jgi:hypothetical protein
MKRIHIVINEYGSINYASCIRSFQWHPLQFLVRIFVVAATRPQNSKLRIESPLGPALRGNELYLTLSGLVSFLRL